MRNWPAADRQGHGSREPVRGGVPVWGDGGGGGKRPKTSKAPTI